MSKDFDDCNKRFTMSEKHEEEEERECIEKCHRPKLVNHCVLRKVENPCHFEKLENPCRIEKECRLKSWVERKDNDDKFMAARRMMEARRNGGNGNNWGNMNWGNMNRGNSNNSNNSNNGNYEDN